MMRICAFAILLATLVASGTGSGLLVGRWGNSQQLQEAVARLNQEPLSAGEEWDVTEGELSEREVAIAGIDGYILRRFVNRQTGGAVSVLLVCGKYGPISVHTPDICYGGAGYVLSGPARPWENPHSPKGQFQVLDFHKPSVTQPSALRIFLSWGSEGTWTAPANPRLAFAGKPYLYKLYVIREIPRAGAPLDQDPAAELIAQLLPRLQRALFPAS